MTRSLVLLLLMCAPCWSQTTSTGKAETTGPCSPAVTGNNNQFKITCQGISDKLGAQLVELLNKVAKSQVDADTMMAKLDGCLAEQQKLKETLGGWKLDPEAQSRLIDKLKPYAGTPFVLYANPDEANFMGTIDYVLEQAGWKWQMPAVGGSPYLGTYLLGGKAALKYEKGLYVLVDENQLKTLGDAAAAFATALQAEHIPMQPYRTQHSQNAVQVIIGKRE